MKKALKKYVEYIKLEPLDVSVHYRIGKIYSSLGQMNHKIRESPHTESTDVSLLNEQTNSLEEAMLHFEQVIKHNEHCRTI